MGRQKKKRKTTLTKKPQPPPSPQPPLDRLTSLPDALLVDILTLLPTKTAVSTSVLSTRCRLLWTQLPHLSIDSSHFPSQSKDFYAVADRLLTRLTSPIIHTFSLCAPYPCSEYFEPWLRHLCSRNAQTIKISVAHPSTGDSDEDAMDLSFTLPLCVFKTPTLVCLNLPPYRLNYNLPLSVDDVIIRLPNLTKLVLGFSASECEFLVSLLRSCPLLQDLSLTVAKSGDAKVQNGVIIDIQCLKLKRMLLNFVFVADDAYVVVIDAPELVCFGFYAKFATCSFVKKPVALRDALIFTPFEPLVLSLLPMISNVTKLHILAMTFVMFESLAFSNLTELSLQLSGGVVDDLNTFPSESASPRLLCRVKTIDVIVTKVRDGKCLKKLMEYLLSNAPVLEKLAFVVIHHPSQCDDKGKYHLEEMLCCLDLYSSTANLRGCLLEFRGIYAKLPTNETEFMLMKYFAQLLRAFLAMQDLQTQISGMLGVHMT